MLNTMRKHLSIYSINHFISGLIIILVGYTASVALIFQAAQTVGANLPEATSWIFAVCMAMGIASALFSLYWKIPVVMAWSTPGVALLIISAQGINLKQMIGVFVFVSLLTVLTGLTGAFEKLMRYVPIGISSALLAGVLVQLTINIFPFFKTQPLLITAMFVTYWVFKYLNSRFVMFMVVLVGIMVAYFLNLLSFENYQFEFFKPVFTFPDFDFKSIIGVGIPLYLVTMTGQNIPGYTIAKNHGYNLPISKILTGSGIIYFFMSFFGCFSLNLAALTAAIAMDKDVDKDQEKRYLASVTSGLISIAIALFAGSIAYLLHLFPKELTLTIAGLALIGTTTNSLKSAFANYKHSEIIFIVFCVAASGVQFLGMNSAFWSFIIGFILNLIFNKQK